MLRHTSPLRSLVVILVAALPLAVACNGGGDGGSGPGTTTDGDQESVAEIETPDSTTDGDTTAPEVEEAVEEPAEEPAEQPAEEAAEEPAEQPAEEEEALPVSADRLRCGDSIDLQVPLDAACYPEGPHGYRLGDVVANIEWEDCAGNPVNFKELVGEAKAILVTESAGWCTVCRAEAPRLEGLYQRYKDQGFIILQPLFEDNAAKPSNRAFCASWRDEYGLTYPVINDPGHKTVRFHPDPARLATPLNMILDKNMRVQFVVEGLYPQTLEPQIRRILGIYE